eukprot:jgi/Chrzof1/12562/UNPLg00514.t1
MTAATAVAEVQQQSGSTVTPAAREALFSKATEQLEEVPARVSGSIPDWLEGSLIVNGGGDYTFMRHMFDGYAFVSKIRVGQGGQVWGAQRFIKTKAYDAFQKKGGVVLREFATPPSSSGPVATALQVAGQVFSMALGFKPITDNASVSLQYVGAEGDKKLMALGETPMATYLVDPSTLSTIQQFKFSDGVSGDLTTAHPSVLSDGTYVNFTRSVPMGGFHLYKQDPVTLKRTEITFVRDRHPLSPAWLHDFAATDKYAILFEHPLYMNLAGLLVGEASGAEYVFMDWKRSEGTRVHVVALDGSQPTRTFQAPPFFVFHFGNAFESPDGNTLYVDMAAYDDPTIVNDLHIDPLKAGSKELSPSWYKRITIPLDGSTNTLQAPQPLVKDPVKHSYCDFPMVNPALRGQPYRYAYTFGAVWPTCMGNALTKIDTHSGDTWTWHEPGAAPSEPQFVARPGSTSEDDGVVMSTCMGPHGNSFLIILDAASWTELARAQLPYATPVRFHGTWVPAAS